MTASTAAAGWVKLRPGLRRWRCPAVVLPRRAARRLVEHATALAAAKPASVQRCNALVGGVGLVVGIHECAAVVVGGGVQAQLELRDDAQGAACSQWAERF